ncbi:MAG TPA: hypothetical protein VD866_23150 [Urbifossiella sp.]|nr:hypothetical protein [Urbifossiella sp.]
MSDLVARIHALTPVTAGRVLIAITTAQVRRGAAKDIAPDTALTDALASAAGITPDAGATDEDVAKAGLLLLAADPATAEAVDGLVEHPPAEGFADPLTLGIGVAALVVLQSYIKVERDKAGKWAFKFEKQPMSDSLLKHLISKLGGWLRG